MLSRIDGREDLYVGGIFAFRRSSVLEEKNITHVLSVIKYSLAKTNESRDSDYVHMSIDVDDVEDEDILVHLPAMVRFIERGLYGDGAFAATAAANSDSDDDDDDDDDDITPAPAAAAAAGRGPGAVFVHCAMGKSRSVTAVVAWLLWKYPHRFAGRRRGTTAAAGTGKASDSTEREGEGDGDGDALAAVARAVEWVRRARGIAEPNPGFVRQLALWWEMGCPAEAGDDAVERHRVYRRWAYRREVEESAKIGRAPDRLRFEDEVGDDEVGGAAGGGGRGDALDGGRKDDGPGLELRCKKCRRVLVTKPFVVPHQIGGGGGTAGESPVAATTTTPASCQHFFVEPLSWMRPVLEEGALEGRLVCPNAKCGASIGRYSWRGFKCTCREWVCPAFSLQRNRVDDVAIARSSVAAGGGAAVGAQADRMAAMGIRLPPGARVGVRKENL